MSKSSQDSFEGKFCIEDIRYASKNDNSSFADDQQSWHHPRAVVVIGSASLRSHDLLDHEGGQSASGCYGAKVKA
jgi:hypothetical protein